MAAKKSAARKSSARNKKAVKKKPAAARRKKSAVKKKTVRKRPAKKKPAKKKKTATKRKSVKSKAGPAKRSTRKKTGRSASLGRPRVPADARLDLVFQKDYQAREIFEFLHVQTVRELEQYGPDEIIERLTGPMVQTVERIRKALALSNRCLARDHKFARQFQAKLKRGH